MRTIKKVIYVLLSAMLIALCCVMVACQNEHVHSYAPEWSSDDNYHWHEPLCDDTEKVLQAHKFKDGKCEICGKEKEDIVPGDTEPTDPSDKEPGDKDPSGSGDKDPSGSGDKDPSGSGDKDPSGSGDKDPSGSGDKDPSGSDDKDPSGSGDKDPSGSGDKDPDDKDDDKPVTPSDTSGVIKKELSEYFNGVTFGELKLEADIDEAYSLATRVERMFESGKGFVGGDMIIGSISGNSMFGTGQEWYINNIGTSIDEATKDLRVCSEEYISSTGYDGLPTKNFSTRYADMTNAYGLVTPDTSSVSKYTVKDAAKYMAREGTDNAVYIIDQIAVLLENDSTTKKFRKDGDMYYINLTAETNVSYGGLYNMTIKTTLNVVFYKGLLLALDYNESDNLSGGTNNYHVYSTVFDKAITMPTNVTEAESKPSWLAIPHVGALDEKVLFSDENMTELKEETDHDRLYDMCNKFYYSIYYTQGGMSYVGAHGDLNIEYSLPGTNSKVTVDRSSSLDYLIHKTTSRENKVISEQYLDGEYLYEKFNSDEENSEKTRKFEDEYSESYLDFINGEMCEQLLFAMTTYYAGVSNPDGIPEGSTNIPPSQITKFIPKDFTVKYKEVDDLIVYKVRLSDTEDATDLDGCTEMEGYYVYDASGKLYAAKFTYKVYYGEDDYDFSEIKLLIGEYPVTVPEAFKNYSEATLADDPYLEF